MSETGEPGVLCICGHATYASTPIVVGQGQNIAFELNRAWHWTCLKCGARWFTVNSGGVTIKHHVPGDEIWDVVAKMTKDQTDLKGEPYIVPDEPVKESWKP